MVEVPPAYEVVVEWSPFEAPVVPKECGAITYGDETSEKHV